METTESLQKQITDVFDSFYSVFNKVSTEFINAEPNVGSWTIGQLGQHVTLASAGLPDQKNESANRPADQFENSIRETFLDHSQKFKSPDFIDPERKLYNKEALLETLKSNKDVLLNIVKKQPLEYVCKDVEFPGWGNLTRYEWIKLIIYHMRRHTTQLIKLQESFLK